MTNIAGNEQREYIQNIFPFFWEQLETIRPDVIEGCVFRKTDGALKASVQNANSQNQNRTHGSRPELFERSQCLHRAQGRDRKNHCEHVRKDCICTGSSMSRSKTA